MGTADRRTTGRGDANGMGIFEGDRVDCGCGAFTVAWCQHLQEFGVDIGGYEWYCIADYVGFGCVVVPSQASTR